MPTPLNRDSQFIVKEEKILGYVLAILLFGLFAYGFIDLILHNFAVNASSFVFSLALAGSIFFFGKARSKRIYIRINIKGIYQEERLVAGWDKMIKVFINQNENPRMLDIRDNFQLVVEYWKNDPTKGFRKRIPLTNTQNKSEEEVIEAVRFFWDQYKEIRGLGH